MSSTLEVSASAPRPAAPRTTAEPILAGEKSLAKMFLFAFFTIVPFLALAAAVPLAWGWGLAWLDVGLGVFFYALTGLGVTIGFHRYFTHRAFTARRGLRITLAIAGSMAMQGPIIGWVADHRRHHAYADRDGDPHSPWRFGTSPTALAKGFWHAHMGWLFEREQTNAARFAPDLRADPDLQKIDRLSPARTSGRWPFSPSASPGTTPTTPTPPAHATECSAGSWISPRALSGYSSGSDGFRTSAGPGRIG